MIAATLFLCIFVILGGVVMFLSKTIDAGEARFDSETGKAIDDKEAADKSATDKNPARPATRITDKDQTTGDEA